MAVCDSSKAGRRIRLCDEGKSEHLQSTSDRDFTAWKPVTGRASEIMAFVKKQGLEGLVAKRADSVYQPGLRTVYGRSTA
jgi:ATP-dependent DNA ligase